MKYTIISVCVGEFGELIKKTVPSWLRENVEKVIIYSDKDYQYADERVDIRPELSPETNWIKIVGMKVKAVRDFLSISDAENVLFLDLDCYLAEDVGDVFKSDFDIAVASDNKISKGSNCGVWFGKNTPKLRMFIKQWAVLQDKFYKQRKGLKAHAPSYHQLSFNELLPTMNVLKLPEEEYNSRRSMYGLTQVKGNEKWLASGDGAKILHFVNNTWKDEKLFYGMTEKKREKLKLMTWLWTQKNSRFLYTSKHVNEWAKKLSDNLTIPHSLACVTDTPDGIDSNVEIIPLPKDFVNLRTDKWPESRGRPQCYRRLVIFKRDAEKIFKAKRFVSMDMDMHVFGNLDSVFNRDEDFIMTPNGAIDQRPYNGSMIMMNAGARPQVYEKFSLKNAEKASSIYVGSDQAWIAYVLGWCEVTWKETDGVYVNSTQLYNRRKDRMEDCLITFFPGADKRGCPFTAEDKTQTISGVVRVRAKRPVAHKGRKVKGEEFDMPAERALKLAGLVEIIK